VIAVHGLHSSSQSLLAPQLLLGAGIGMLISTLFDFILASVTDREIGSASGVLNAAQQLAGALGVAIMGTVFFTALSHSGYVSAMSRCLLVELGTTPLLLALTSLLPKHAREDDAVTVEPSGELRPPARALASEPA